MKGFLLAPEAFLDLESLSEYIARDNPDAADRVLDKLEAAFRKLATAPGMGHTRSDLAGSRELLFWPVGNYLVIYRARNALPLEIIAVVHGNRDIPTFLTHRRPV